MDKAKVILDAVFSVDREEIEKIEKYSCPVRFLAANECKPKQLENAVAGFAAGCAAEDIVVLADTTFIGNGKKGFLFAKDAFYGDKSTFTSGGFGKSCVSYPLFYDELEDVFLDQENSSYLFLHYKNKEKKRVFGNISSRFLAAVLSAVIKALAKEQELEDKKINEIRSLEKRLEEQKVSRLVKERILLLYPQLKQYRFFSRTDVAEKIEVSTSVAGELMKKMKEADLIEPVTGYGNGKYRFK